MGERFWQWVKNEEEAARTLFLNGPIAEETWWGDEVTPKMFKDDLLSGKGPVTVWINSPGGDFFAGSQIYNMLREYKDTVTVKIDGIAASAASVVAMAGSRVYMSPVSVMIIHNPQTWAWGDGAEMQRAKQMLDAVKEAIINAYEIKSGQTRAKISRMMDNQTTMDAQMAVNLKFADAMLYKPDSQDSSLELVSASLENKGYMYSGMSVMNSLLAKIRQSAPKEAGTPIQALEKRLALIKN